MSRSSERNTNNQALTTTIHITTHCMSAALPALSLWTPDSAPAHSAPPAMAVRGSSLDKLVRLGAAALLPTKSADGTWRGAALSAKALARLRRDARLEGREWPYEQSREPSTVFQRLPKGHRADREAPVREARVVAGLARQVDLLGVREKARAPKVGAEAFLDRELLTTKELRIKSRGVVAAGGKK